MECRTPRNASAITTCIAVPGLLLGLSKLCKLTKVCAVPPPSLDCAGGAKLSNAGGYDEKLVVEILLEAVGSLKSAYVKLQRAHVPYDPARIAAGGEAVAALQCLCSSSSSSTSGGGGVGKLVEERWSLVQELEGEARKRESDIVALRRELEGLRRASSRLAEQIKTSRASVRRSKIAVVPRQVTTTTTMTGSFLELFMAVQGFAELIASLTPPAPSSSSSDRSTSNGDERCRSRGRYTLEAHLWRTMLGAGGAGTGEEEEEEGFEFDAARFVRVMGRRDPLDALAEEHPISGGFATFCRSRYLAAVPPETERAALGNLDHRAFVSRGGHPRTWFYRAFATAATAAWALRAATEATRGCRSGAGTGTDAARMFYARGGSRYPVAHMRSVVATAAVGGEGRGGGEDEKLGVVAFTVAPGLSFGGAVAVACRVFLRDSEDADDVQKSVSDPGVQICYEIQLAQRWTVVIADDMLLVFSTIISFVR